MLSQTKNIVLAIGLVGLAGLQPAQASRHAGPSSSFNQAFQRIGIFANYTNRSDIEDETVSEIVSATANGRTLVYTDGEQDAIGFVDIADPRMPVADGIVELSGEPTSVAVFGNSLALVGVNTSESLTNPSGNLTVVDIATRQILAELDLGGQPDSVAISPNRRYVAIAIENERDEDIIVDGVEGGLPQLPAGYLAIVDIRGADPSNWRVRQADLTGLSSYAPEDPEPEFVSINRRSQAVVTMQENNHTAIVDLRTGQVIGDFDMGAVTLQGVDAVEDGVIALTDTLTDVVREPDAVAWVPGDRPFQYRIATANEGDLFGGSRGFSIFEPDGTVVFDSATSFEELAVRHGHYPEERSENKGSEPEAILYSRFGNRDLLFVGSERGSFVAVYELLDGQPVFQQLLPAPLGPEGLLAIPRRRLLIVSGEDDDPSFGVRSTMMIYSLGRRGSAYPQIVSEDLGGASVPWSAMSGMVATGNDSELLAVWDSFYSVSNIFTIDASKTPAEVTGQISITGGTGNYDPEGIAIAPDGTYWIASEGQRPGDDARANRLLQVDSNGMLLAEIGLPAEIEACRAASTNTGSLGAGFEGLAVMPADDGSGYKLLVAQQRGWDYTTPECEDLDDDPTGANSGEPTQTRVWIYDVATGTWDHFSWELEPLPANASWVGLSEITAAGEGQYILIERDNRTGDFTELKTLVSIDIDAAADGITRAEKSVYDLPPGSARVQRVGFGQAGRCGDHARR